MRDHPIGAERLWPLHVVTSLAASFFASLMAQTPPSKPGPEHKKIEYYVGTWTVESNVKASPFGPAGTNTIKQTYELLPGGFFILSRWDGKTTMGPVQGLAVLGYNSVMKAYTWNGFDNFGWHGTGKGTLQGAKWSWTTESYVGDKVIKGRYTETETSATAYTFKFEMQGDNGSWSTVEEGKATKTK